MENDGAFDLVNARNLVALLIGFRITATDQHDADGGSFVESDGMLVEVTLCHPFEEVDDVCLQAQHDGLSLGIAHAAVVFDDHRLTLDVDESEEDKALIVNAFGS